MAFTSKFVYVIVMVLFCLALLTPPPSALPDQCKCGHGCLYTEAAVQAIPNRKLLQGMHGNEVVVSKVQGSTTNGYGGAAGSETWELRRVPAGPDPLHHHGGTPKEPRTP